MLAMIFIACACAAEPEDEKSKEKSKSEQAKKSEKPVMDNERLGKLLKKRLKNLEGQAGAWRAKVDDRTIMIYTDERANRMRIMIPIQKIDKEDTALAFKLLEANFDRALDAKYAVNGEILWSVFLHPFQTLSEPDLDNALKQVVKLAENTGTTYTSSELIFGGGVREDDETPEKSNGKPKKDDKET